jgi:hypothetical protein
MSTKSEAAASNAAKKGPSAKRTRKLSQRKPKRTSKVVAPPKARPHERRDAPSLITAEVAASSPKARATRTRAHATRVRSSGPK